MALVVLNSTLSKVYSTVVNRLNGGYFKYNNTVAKDGMASQLRLTLERADNNVIVGKIYSNADGSFMFSNLAQIKHVLTAQDPAGIKLARSTTIIPLPLGGGLG